MRVESLQFRCNVVYKLRYWVSSNVLPAMAVMSDLPLTLMSESVLTIPAVLLDPQNVCVAFGISLLPCIEAEILRFFTSTSG